MNEQDLKDALARLRREPTATPAAPRLDLGAARLPSRTGALLPAVLVVVGVLLPGADPAWTEGLSRRFADLSHAWLAGWEELR
jgi:hypothetical protein